MSPKTQEVKNLKDFGNFKYDNMVKMDDVAGKPLTIHAADFTKGQFGNIVIIRAATAEGELISIVTGSAVIASGLHDVAMNDAFPVEATFVKKGRMWFVE
jgi:hypothetical protein